MGEVSQALWMLGMPDSHPMQLRAWNFLLQHESKNRADGLRQGQWLRGAGANFYGRYHTAYCVVIGLAPQIRDPEQTPGMPAAYRNYFRQTKFLKSSAVEQDIRSSRESRQNNLDQDSGDSHNPFLRQIQKPRALSQSTPTVQPVAETPREVFKFRSQKLEPRLQKEKIPKVRRSSRRSQERMQPSAVKVE